MKCEHCGIRGAMLGWIICRHCARIFFPDGLSLNRDGGPWIEQGRRTRIAYLRRARASSPEPRGEDVADKLWKMCVEDGWPWSEGAIQDQLTELGLLYAKDMTAEDSGPECTNCEGDCRTCYRAVEHVRDAKPLPLPLTKGGAL